VPARRMLPVVVVVALLPAAGAAGRSLGAEAHPTQPAPAREALAQVVNPRGAAGRTLGLSRVTIPARTALAPHRHPGNQIAYIERGTLTYTVRTGVVRVFRGTADASPRLVATIRAGDTGRVRAGEWVVERQGDVHFGANRGRRPLVILLATLFTNGSPASIPVK
jgi:quercetin dioxygenase-like cupin family protein